jgi:hypothetical protein
MCTTTLIDQRGKPIQAPVATRSQLLQIGRIVGSALLIDAEATTYVPAKWNAEARPDGAVMLSRHSEARGES